MKCEYCGKTLRQGDTVHGLKYGSLVFIGFMPAKDSAVTVMCGPCGEMVFSLVYAKHDPGKPTYPALFKIYHELTDLMRNGYKLIEGISKLPVSDQTAIQRLITVCKQS